MTYDMPLNDDETQAKFIGTDSIDRPDGSRKLPARTCGHLAKVNPHLPDGRYWIDPNAGSIMDAIEVHCNIRTGETCVSPSKAEFEAKHYESASAGREYWLHELAGGNSFEYSVSGDQLSFLKMLSARAKQNLTVICRQSSQVDARLMSDNDQYFSRDGELFRYNVLRDECQYMKDSYGQMVLEVETRSQRLPVRDISFGDIGGRDKEVGVMLSSVCYA